MTSLLLALATVSAALLFDRILAGAEQSLLSPSRILNLGYPTVLLAGYWFHGWSASDGPGRSVTEVPLDYRLLVAAFAITISCGIGSLAATLLFRAASGNKRRGLPGTTVHIELSSAYLWTTVIPVGILILGKGSALWNGEKDAAIAGFEPLARLGGLLAPIAMLLCAYYAARGMRRTAATWIFGVYVVVLAASATRLVGAAPLLWLLGGYLGGDASTRKEVATARWCVALLASYILFSLVLTLRNLPERGLLPYSEFLLNNPDALWRSPADAVGNILFAVPLANVVAYESPRLPLADLLTSVSPAPSSMTDWSTVAPTLRVHAFIPYNALGELLNYGIAVTVTFFAVASFCFSSLFANSRRAALPVRIAGEIFSLGLVGLFLVVSLEYNLRAAARYAWIALFAALVLGFVGQESRRRPYQDGDGRFGQPTPPAAE
jgi:hypothetical protein